MARSSVIRRVAGGFVVTLAAAAVAICGSQAQAAGGGGTINVLLPGDSIGGSYSHLSCKVVSGKHGKRFVATSPFDSEGWQVKVALNKFHGFHKYKLKHGDFDSQAWWSRRHNGAYSTLFNPDGVSRDAGYVKFGKDKKGKPDKSKILVQALAYYSGGGYTAVALGGQAKCKYKK